MDTLDAMKLEGIIRKVVQEELQKFFKDFHQPQDNPNPGKLGNPNACKLDWEEPCDSCQ